MTTSTVTEPIEITSAQGVTDALQAALRYLVVIVGFFTSLSAFIGRSDAAGAVTYVQTNLGGVVSAIFGLVALGVAAYGIYKTFKRGAQLVDVEPHAPNSVIRLTDAKKTSR